MITAGQEHRRIPWACRRGLLELDLWLAPLARAHTALNADDVPLCLELLAEPDRVLLDWLEARMPPPAKFRTIIENLRKGCAS